MIAEGKEAIGEKRKSVGWGAGGECAFESNLGGIILKCNISI